MKAKQNQMLGKTYCTNVLGEDKHRLVGLG